VILWGTIAILNFTIPIETSEEFIKETKENKWVKKIERNQIRERCKTLDFTDGTNTEFLTLLGFSQSLIELKLQALGHKLKGWIIIIKWYYLSSS